MIDYAAFLTLDRVAVVDELPSRKTALHQLGELLGRGPSVLSNREVFFKLQEREQQASTALDELPVAIPHCRMTDCLLPTGSLLKTRHGNSVDFGGQQIQLMIGMCFPKEATEDASKILRIIVQVLEDEARLAAILAADSSESLFKDFQGNFLAEAATCGA